MGSSLAIFFQINKFRRFYLSVHSKGKLLTRGKIEKHLTPYNFNSKGGNLRQVVFLIEFEALCLEFFIK